MAKPDQFDFNRYLAAKRALDDRSLNQRCWDELLQRAKPTSPKRPLEILEAGAGLGTMLTRLVDWGLEGSLSYTGVDVDPSLTVHGESLLINWAKGKGWDARTGIEDGIGISAGERQIQAHLECADIFDFSTMTDRQWDLLIAHSFLDLVDIRESLLALEPLIRDQGLLYFTLVFDGVTILRPTVEPGFDERVIDCYHRSMDPPGEEGLSSGRSETGRALLDHLIQSQTEILCAGSSDWVVYPPYPPEEEYFLHHIIHFMEEALEGCVDLNPERLSHWLETRHKQIQEDQLIYIAHQIDVLARK